MEIVGYVEIKKDATEIKGTIEPQTFKGQICRVMEFERHGDGALIVNPAATSMAMVENSCIARSFKCGSIGDVLTPPGMDLADQIIYSGKVYSRKGGYAPILRQMVIQASLAKGEFTDSFLWQMQDDDTLIYRDDDILHKRKLFSDRIPRKLKKHLKFAVLSSIGNSSWKPAEVKICSIKKHPIGKPFKPNRPRYRGVVVTSYTLGY